MNDAKSWVMVMAAVMGLALMCGCNESKDEGKAADKKEHPAPAEKAAEKKEHPAPAEKAADQVPKDHPAH